MVPAGGRRAACRWRPRASGRCSSTAAARASAGWGIPAFLANVCLPAIYACLIELFARAARATCCCCRTADPGADRGPSAAGLCADGDRGSACCRSGPVFAVRRPAAAVAGGRGDAAGDDRAGRDLRRHPHLQRDAERDRQPAAGASCCGRLPAGRGAVALVRLGPGRRQLHHLRRQGRIARSLQTWAAHNEYLRIQVEGGGSAEHC